MKTKCIIDGTPCINKVSLTHSLTHSLSLTLSLSNPGPRGFLRCEENIKRLTLPLSPFHGSSLRNLWHPGYLESGLRSFSQACYERVMKYMYTSLIVNQRFQKGSIQMTLVPYSLCSEPRTKHFLSIYPLTQQTIG